MIFSSEIFQVLSYFFLLWLQNLGRDKGLGLEAENQSINPNVSVEKKENGHQLWNLGLGLLQLIHWTVIGRGRIWLRLLTSKISIGFSLRDAHPLDVDVDQEVQLSLH